MNTLLKLSGQDVYKVRRKFSEMHLVCSLSLVSLQTWTYLFLTIIKNIIISRQPSCLDRKVFQQGAKER
jgi:hypothetical protein